MYGSFLRSTAFLATIFAVAVYPGKTCSGQQGVGEVSAVTGSAQLRRPGTETAVPISRGSLVGTGDVVTTGPSGRARIIFSDDSLVTLAPQSSVRVNQFNFEPETNRRTAVIQILNGEVRVTVYKVRSPESDVTLQTSTALITLANLGDCVVKDMQGGSTVTVLDQMLSIKNILPFVIGEIRVGQNQTAAILTGRPPSAPTIVPADERRTIIRNFVVR